MRIRNTNKYKLFGLRFKKFFVTFDWRRTQANIDNDADGGGVGARISNSASCVYRSVSSDSQTRVWAQEIRRRSFSLSPSLVSFLAIEKLNVYTILHSFLLLAVCLSIQRKRLGKLCLDSDSGGQGRTE